MLDVAWDELFEETKIEFFLRKSTLVGRRARRLTRNDGVSPCWLISVQTVLAIDAGLTLK